MTTSEDVSSGDIGRCVRRIAAGLQGRQNELTALIQRCLEQEIPELDQDTMAMELLGASVAGNIDALLHAARLEIDVARVQAPTPALEYARRLAQHGVPVHALVRAYRVGQRRFNESVFAEVQATDMEPSLRVAVLQQMTATMFAYIDWISQQVVQVYEEERERWLENQNSLRAMRVREILAGTTADDVDAATAAIRYPLRWTHLAVVLWYPGSGNADELPRIQRFLRELGEAVSSGAAPLFVPVDQTSGWGWLPFRSASPDVIEKARQFAAAQPGAPNVGIGTMALGVSGFRRSHWRAMAVRSLALAGGRHEHSVISASDPGVSVAAFVAEDLDRIRDWVADVLGDLATDTDNDARLRETLRVFLATGGSYKSAAEQLTMHYNTIKYRVGRATARRGIPIGTDRFDVEYALLLCRWYGTAVLRG